MTFTLQEIGKCLLSQYEIRFCITTILLPSARQNVLRNSPRQLLNVEVLLQKNPLHRNNRLIHLNVFPWESEGILSPLQTILGWVV